MSSQVVAHQAEGSRYNTYMSDATNENVRMARCGCGRTAPSDSEGLAFFESRGPLSRSASQCAHCGFAAVAHETTNPVTGRPGVVASGKCPGYEPRGDVGTDTFYCGCRGWD